MASAIELQGLAVFSVAVFWRGVRSQSYYLFIICVLFISFI